MCERHQLVFVLYDDRTTFEAENPGLFVEDFEKARSLGEFDGPLDNSTRNSRFDAGDILPGITFEVVAGRGDPIPDTDNLVVYQNVFPNIGLDTSLFSNEAPGGMGISLNPGVQAFGFDMFVFRNIFVGVEILVFNDFTDIGLFNVLASNNPADPTFFGFFSSDPIFRVEIRNGGTYEYIDDVAFGTPIRISEPINLVLFLAGLAVLGLMIQFGHATRYGCPKIPRSTGAT